MSQDPDTNGVRQTVCRTPETEQDQGNGTKVPGGMSGMSAGVTPFDP